MGMGVSVNFRTLLRRKIASLTFISLTASIVLIAYLSTSVLTSKFVYKRGSSAMIIIANININKNNYNSITILVLNNC